MKTILIISLILCASLAECQDGYVTGDPELAYWEVGTSDDVVIILHGGPCASHEYLRPEFDELSKVAHVVYYDQRGCGLSRSGETYNWQDHVEDLHRVINQFTDNHEVFLAGSSWGSILALLYSYRYPYGIKGVILSGTVPWEGVGKELEYIEWSDVETDRNRTYESQIIEERKKDKEGDIVGGQEIYEKISRAITITTGPPNTNTLYSLKSAPPFQKLESISLPPFLIFRGMQKNPSIPRDWGHLYDAILPKSELVTIDHAGHDPWLADPAYFFKRAKQFIMDNK